MRSWIAILILMGTVLVFAFSALAQGSAAANPFSPYSDLFLKDQTVKAIHHMKFSCIDAYDRYLSDHYQNCLLKPDDRVLSVIHVMLLGGDPQIISFEIEKNTLKVGDLILLWGKPGVIFTYGSPTMVWHENNDLTISVLVPSADHLDYFAPVGIISFTF